MSSLDMQGITNASGANGEPEQDDPRFWFGAEVYVKGATQTPITIRGIHFDGYEYTYTDTRSTYQAFWYDEDMLSLTPWEK